MRDRPRDDGRGAGARCGPLPLALAFAVGGCMIIRNPDFDEPAASSSGTDATTTTGVAATTDETTTLAATTVDATTFAETTSDAGSTAPPPEPGALDVPASLAACVLLPFMAAPYAGPQFCGDNAVVENGTGQAGVLILDESFENQGGESRPARVYLRFEVPAQLAGRTLTAVALRVTFADGETAGSNWSGVLLAVDPFSDADLEEAAPADRDVLAGDPGPCEPEQTVTWTLAPETVTAGQSVYFGLAPVGDDGVLLLGSDAVAGAPVLHVEYE